MKRIGAVVVLTLAALVVAWTGVRADFHATDPGPRQGPAGAGGARAGLNAYYQAFFTAAQQVFQEIDTVASGLGPGFNARSCANCHAQPAIGGTSPSVNPQIADAMDAGATNSIPAFILLNGPVREVRFIQNPDGTADGGVHDLFTIQGRSDAGTCQLTQPDFATAVANGNAIFRIPTPLFGLGLVEEITDANIVAGQQPTVAKKLLGISGVANHSGNTGNVTRFGWKAQNPSLDVFAGEAYNVEQGVTNERFPVERETGPGCNGNALPEDHENAVDQTGGGMPQSGYASDITNFAMFLRLLAPPQPVPLTQSAQRGQQVFTHIGCALCHTPSLQTGATSTVTGDTNDAVNAFSDFLVHDMGVGLQDGVAQGVASGREFRTAPLWGAGQRLFFLHDGRCQDLLCAIEQHDSQGSEAKRVEELFDLLSEQDKQHIVDFLRSL